ncbi:prolyl hydroxylase family protein [Sphingomonas crocodyli]|uniref:2OG-Fe(II) oxygenase n=1 Tax=Sphingomonas crocodyli TaxID=1979270 RepID=A0A437M6D7_9SPHN|nr:2OG-Fe(II) oxygenase [Sphingomonas crocodyli]RVT93064.1 2OG-Fe(II) oxygenase [Sphingomonas crocodyli]
MAAVGVAAGVSGRLAAASGVQKVPSRRADLFVKRDFIPADLCAALIARIDADRRPSTMADHHGDASFRTSESCDLHAALPEAQAIDRAIADLTGLDPTHGEPLQGQRYDVGQEFRDHTDYFEPTGFDYLRYCADAGQRTWTVMIYLNRPISGGATRFRTLDKIVQPEPGKLLAWSNLDPAGHPNPATLHAGLKVRSGVKYVVTKWYRERPWVRP